MWQGRVHSWDLLSVISVQTGEAAFELQKLWFKLERSSLNTPQAGHLKVFLETECTCPWDQHGVCAQGQTMQSSVSAPQLSCVWTSDGLRNCISDWFFHCNFQDCFPQKTFFLSLGFMYSQIALMWTGRSQPPRRLWSHSCCPQSFYIQAQWHSSVPLELCEQRQVDP